MALFEVEIYNELVKQAVQAGESTQSYSEQIPERQRVYH
jgi:hypothetical protein